MLLGLAAGVILQSAGRPDLNGSWQLDVSKRVLHSQVPPGLIWQIEQTADSIHVTQHADAKNDGRDCKVNNFGHPATASFYHNGPVPVELETLGQNRGTVMKKRIRLSEDRSVLTIDVMHFLPEGKEP
jgi:hypothetical protein